MNRLDDEYEALLQQFRPRKPGLPPGWIDVRKPRRVFWPATAASVLLVISALFTIVPTPKGVPQNVENNKGGLLRPSGGTRPRLLRTLTEAFDVASIKATPRENVGPGEPSITLFPPGGNFRKTNTTLRMLTQLAYGLQDYQVVGGPPWTNVERYDVEARSGRDANREEVLRMIQALLADRFQLKVRREAKEDTIYHLVVAKSGPKALPVPDSSSAEVRIGRYGGKRTMAQLAQYLGGIVGRPVVDQTSLQGAFDIHLEFTPDFNPIGPNGRLADPNGPSIFSAIQEQLGLKLEPARGLVEMLFIEEAQRPSPN
jgi:uncharacterized protein (TIGR03435 family)